MLLVRLYPPLSGDLRIHDLTFKIPFPLKISEMPLMAKAQGHDIFKSVLSGIKCNDGGDICGDILILRNDEVVRPDEYIQDGDVVKIVLLSQGG